MKALSFLHRWSGGLIGALLALLGLTGAILVWEGEWIGVTGANDPVVERVDRIAAISERAVADGATRITFASDEIGLHLVAKEGGAGEYVRQDGSIVASWASQWERPELWLFDLHHHLFAGETGEWVTGIAGIFGLLFVITGSILWWRSRRAFEWRLWPRKFQPGPIVRHHRDFGIVVAPLLLISFLTGLGMLFPSAARIALSPFGALPAAAKPPVVEPATQPAPIDAMLRRGESAIPRRRASPPDHPGQARRRLFGPDAPAVRMDSERPDDPLFRPRREASPGSTIRQARARRRRSTRNSIPSTPARPAGCCGSW